MGAMQGMNLTQVYDRIADVLWDTQVAQWTFVSTLCFIEFIGHNIIEFIQSLHSLYATVDSSAIVELSICTSEASAQCCFAHKCSVDSIIECMVPS